MQNVYFIVLYFIHGPPPAFSIPGLHSVPSVLWVSPPISTLITCSAAPAMPGLGSRFQRPKMGASIKNLSTNEAVRVSPSLGADAPSVQSSHDQNLVDNDACVPHFKKYINSERARDFLFSGAGRRFCIIAPCIYSVTRCWA